MLVDLGVSVGVGSPLCYASRGFQPLRSNLPSLLRKLHFYLELGIRDYEVYQTRGVMRFRGYFDDLRGNQLASFDFVKVAGNRTRAAENKPEELRIEAVKR